MSDNDLEMLKRHVEKYVKLRNKYYMSLSKNSNVRLAEIEIQEKEIIDLESSIVFVLTNTFGYSIEKLDGIKQYVKKN